MFKKIKDKIFNISSQVDVVKSANEPEIKKLKSIAESSERDSDWKNAIVTYKKLINIDPENPEWQNSLGFVLSEDEQWQEAISVYSKLTEIDTENANIFYNLGRIYTEIDDLDIAINYLDKAISINPEHVDALCYLATVLQELNHFEKSISYFRKTIELDPYYHFGYFNMAISYFAQGDIENAIQCLEQCSEILHGKPINDELEDKINAIEIESNLILPPFKILHDSEQFDYLAKKFKTQIFEDIASAWKSFITDSNLMDYEKEQEFINSGIDLNEHAEDIICKTVNQPIIIQRSKRVINAINPELDFDSIQEEFINGDMQALTIDNILSDEAWHSLLEFCNTNTFWYGLRPGYLGAYSQDGFYSELLFQIAYELKERFPRIFKYHIWRNYWAFKHDSNHGGINIHADEAAVNVNFWVTPSEANLNPNTGGLLVWNKRPPQDWNFKKYNNDQDAILEFIKSENSEPVRFPYQENRALIFSSDLFHKTDEVNFKSGYTNRRLNITMLYGNRKDVNKWD